MIISFTLQMNWGPEKLCNLPKFSEFVHNTAKLKPLSFEANSSAVPLHQNCLTDIMWRDGARREGYKKGRERGKKDGRRPEFHDYSYHKITETVQE